MERKLASIRKIKELRPIEGADLIELAIVDGWQCVVKKGEFVEGDMGIYFEIDSYLPLEPEFEFLRKSCFKKMGEEEGLRLKTIKLRGQLSQGLILPYHSVQRFFTDNPFNSFEKVVFELGADVTDILGVRKYEPPVPVQLAGAMEGVFPSFIRKTDQERIQNVFDSHNREYSDNNDTIIQKLTELDPIKHKDRINELQEQRTLNPIKSMEFECTIKLDGTSTTYFVIDPKKYQTKKISETPSSELPEIYFGVCGRNWELKEVEGNTYWDVAKKSIKDKLIQYHKETNRNIAIQGELMGPGIQGNRESLKEHKFFLYDIWDIDNQRYMTPDERSFIVDYLGVDMVPIHCESIKPFDPSVFSSLDDILLYAEGPSISHKIREGLVFKSKETVHGSIISFKAISNKFLLKGGE